MSEKLFNRSYDLLIIGSGPAGVNGALEAAKLGKRVAIIEKHPESIGGAWLHTGTIPSKTYRETLAAIQSIHPHLAAHWVERLVGNISSACLQNRVEQVSREEEKQLYHRLQEANVDILRGSACLEGSEQVRVTSKDGDSQIVSAEFILIATGSKPRRPTHIPFDGWRVLDSDEILMLEQLPKSIIVFGAGVIGCEYACIFQALGVETTIVDERSRIMRCYDREIADELMMSMASAGVKFKLGSQLHDIQFDGPKVIANFSQETITADLFFFAAGRESCSQNLGLESLGIDTCQRGTIKVNSYFQSSIPNIYAAGDVIGAPALASTSAEQGRIAALHAFGHAVSFPEVFPLGIYTIPEMSCVGKNEEELIAEGRPYVVGKARFQEIARGSIRGDSFGLLKLIVCAESHCILGVHLVGNDAANLVHIGQLCMLSRMPVQNIVNDIIFNYPTLAEGYKIAAAKAVQELEKFAANKSISVA